MDMWSPQGLEVQEVGHSTQRYGVSHPPSPRLTMEPCEGPLTHTRPSSARRGPDYLVPVTGGQRAYATPEDSLQGPGDSAVVSNPTFQSNAGGGDSSRSRDRAASMSAD